jgi:hypothetical protein
MPPNNGGDSSVALRIHELVRALNGDHDPISEVARPNCAMYHVSLTHRWLVFA